MTGRTLTDPRSLRTSSDRWFLTPSLRVVQAFTQVRHGLSKLATRDEASKHAGRVERLEERLGRLRKHILHSSSERERRLFRRRGFLGGGGVGCEGLSVWRDFGVLSWVITRHPSVVLNQKQETTLELK